jgi:hypothetical protein
MIKWLLLVSLYISAQAQAQVHYTVHDPDARISQETSVQTFEFQTWSTMEFLQRQAAQLVDLLTFDQHNGEMPPPKEKYERLKHFGPWAIIEDCFDTRAEVLIRDSSTDVKFSPNNHCKVATGTWDDPYTGTKIRNAADIQIDHVVPLKNAYVSGAWNWKPRIRCLYANFLENDFHLLSVSGHENQSKSDKTPEEYMPPNQDFACEYLKDWLEIKLIWSLSLTESEAKAVKKIARENSCSDLSATLNELRDQRKKIDNLNRNAAFCL